MAESTQSKNTIDCKSGNYPGVSLWKFIKVLFCKDKSIKRKDIISYNSIKILRNYTREVEKLGYVMNKSLAASRKLRWELMKISRKRKRYTISTPLIKVHK